MAKMVGFVGTISGRAGNMVYSKRNGLTIARAYQPQVANPKSVSQMTTRAKFKLASQTAARLSVVGEIIAAANAWDRLNRRGLLVADIFDLVSRNTTITNPSAVSLTIQSLSGLIHNPTSPFSLMLNSVARDEDSGNVTIQCGLSNVEQAGVLYVSSTLQNSDVSIPPVTFTTSLSVAANATSATITIPVSPEEFSNQSRGSVTAVFVGSSNSEVLTRLRNLTGPNTSTTTQNYLWLFGVLSSRSDAFYSRVFSEAVSIPNP